MLQKNETWQESLDNVNKVQPETGQKYARRFCDIPLSVGRDSFPLLTTSQVKQIAYNNRVQQTRQREAFEAWSKALPVIPCSPELLTLGEARNDAGRTPAALWEQLVICKHPASARERVSRALGSVPGMPSEDRSPG